MPDPLTIIALLTSAVCGALIAVLWCAWKIQAAWRAGRNAGIRLEQSRNLQRRNPHLS